MWFPERSRRRIATPAPSRPTPTISTGIARKPVKGSEPLPVVATWRTAWVWAAALGAEPESPGPLSCDSVAASVSAPFLLW